MPAQRKIVLIGEEKRALRELRQAQTVPQRIRKRAHILQLNAQVRSTSEIASIFECHPHTVRTTIRRWEYREIGDLWGKCNVLCNSGAVLTRSEQYSDAITSLQAAYLKLSRYEEALDYCDRALIITTDLNIPLAKECQVLKCKVLNSPSV